MIHFVGEGGFDSRNTIQLIHTVFFSLPCLEIQVEESGRVSMEEMHANEQMPVDLLDSVEAPKDLVKAMQEPLVTRWWTIGNLAILTTKHLDFFLLLAKGVCNITNTDVREDKIASNLLSLASSEWIVADVHFIAGIAKDWLNPHMKWYQDIDANIGRPGFLSFHRSVRYFLMVDHVGRIRRDWKTNKVFENFSKQVATMTNPKLKLLKEGMVEAFLKKM
jgi:hypothetical protein